GGSVSRPRGPAGGDVAGQPGPAPLARRQALVGEPRLALQARLRERLAQAGGPGRLAVEQELPAQVLGRTERVLATGQVALERDGGMPALARLAHWLAAPADRSRQGTHQAGEGAQQRRLAAAVGSTQLD